ncbi:MAG: prolyl oligopeptidase family serine peptidase [Planctomycetota bacterium]
MRVAVLCAAWLFVIGCASPGEEVDDPIRTTSEITLDRLLFGPSLTGRSPSSLAWSPDGARLAFLDESLEKPGRMEIRTITANGGGDRGATSPYEGEAGVREFAWMPSGAHLVYLRGNELWKTDHQSRSERLFEFRHPASDLAVSPDGRFASVRMRGDLWLVELETGVLRQATSVYVRSISDVRFGRYRRPEVEVGPGIWGGPTYAWSKDSKTVAVHHVDRRGVRAVPFPFYLGDQTDPNLVRRGSPGEPNEARTVGLVDVDNLELTLLDLPNVDSTRIVDFSWSSSGRLLIDRDSDTAEDRWLHVYDPETAELSELWHDQRSSRIYTSAGSAWHSDGEHVVFLGDLADRYGLYAISASDREPRLLSQPGFDVTSPPLVTDSGDVFFQANDPSPYERQVFRVRLDGEAPVRLTTEPGENRPYPSPDGSHLATLRSSDQSPTELYLLDLVGKFGEQRITRSRPDSFEARGWAEARYLTFPSLVDETTLHARLLVPADFDETLAYPVLFGPVYSNTVRNRWGGFYANLQQLLVSKGYLVVQVDVRGSTGYGRQFREDFLGDFAGKDLEDLESAVRFLESQSFVDPDRIGIWGSSYGGTLTIYSLLKKPGLFDAGVACAAAVDPVFFGSDDVAIVRRPETHPEFFERGARQYARNLEDPLLLIHGMQDQVVPFKTVVDLAEELMRQGKDFDFAFAPAATHGWTRPNHYARYLLGKLIAHFDRHLGPGLR